MASHAFWAAAVLISVTTGRRYAAESLREFGGIGGLCDAAFANGNNGPFGYGQNAAAESVINRVLLAGACLAAALAIWSIRLHAYRLAVINLVIGAVGGTVAMVSVFGQHERNPYCSPTGWWMDAVVTGALLTAAAATTSSFGRQTGPADGGPKGSRVTARRSRPSRSRASALSDSPR